jgi:hypothetical protein
MTMAMDEGENSVWMRFLAITCYSLWFWRNKLVHDDAFVMPMNPCTEIKRKIHHYDVVANMVVANASPMTVIEEIRWLPPKMGWIRLNTDGASK